MYNLFVTGEFGYWERHRSYKLELSRTSEFLDPGILGKYRKCLSTRKDLPCLFSYEGLEGHGRVGKLVSVREDDGVCTVEYQLTYALPPIPIFSKDTYLRLGCVDRKRNQGWPEWERTHWAVKDIDLYNVVAEIYGEKLLDANLLPVNDLDKIGDLDMKRIWGDGNANRPRLFISHKAAHRGKVQELAETLNTRNIRTFVAHHDVEPGQEWRNEILNALNTMTHFVALLTDDFHGSIWTDQEVGYSFGRNKPRLFVKLSDGDPSGLASAEQAEIARWCNIVEKIDDWLTTGSTTR